MAAPFSSLIALPARSGFLPGFLRAGYALVLKRFFSLLRRPMDANVPGLGLMRLEPWDFIDSRIFFFGVWEPTLTRYMQRAIKPGSVVADVGANIGYFTLLMSRAVGPEGRVYAVEPSPEIRARLEDALTRNGIRNVIVVPYGISDRTERRSFSLSSANLGASKFGEPSEDGIELRRLSEVIPAADLARLSFIKIDVEGMEAPVMRDLCEILPQLPRALTVCAELRIDEEMQRILAAFSASGFSAEILPNAYSMFAYPTPPAEPQIAPIPREGQHDLALTRR